MTCNFAIQALTSVGNCSKNVLHKYLQRITYQKTQCTVQQNSNKKQPLPTPCSISFEKFLKIILHDSWNHSSLYCPSCTSTVPQKYHQYVKKTEMGLGQDYERNTPLWEDMNLLAIQCTEHSKNISSICLAVLTEVTSQCDCRQNGMWYITS